MPRVTITVPGKTPQPYRFQLDRQSVMLGRGSENDILIDCESISGKHAEMRRIDGGYELRDVGSTNGIKADGERREVVRLHSGQTVMMGDVDFDFELTGEEIAELALEKPAPAEDEPVVHEKPALPALPSEEVGEPEPEDEVVTKPRRSYAGMILLFLILALAAFVAGMAVRYQKDTGDSWLKGVLDRGAKQEAPAASGTETTTGTEADSAVTTGDEEPVETETAEPVETEDAAETDADPSTTPVEEAAEEPATDDDWFGVPEEE